MAEIEDERAAGKGLQHRVDRTVECHSAGNKGQWIEIALDRQARLNAILRKPPIDRPVKPDGIHRSTVHIASHHRTSSTRKPNDLRTRHLLAYLFGGPPRGLDAPAYEFLRCQNASPGIEDLHRIDPGLELTNQIGRRGFDEHFDQRVHPNPVTIAKQPRWS